jgi:hypothetical protein
MDGKRADRVVEAISLPGGPITEGDTSTEQGARQ